MRIINILILFVYTSFSAGVCCSQELIINFSDSSKPYKQDLPKGRVDSSVIEKTLCDQLQSFYDKGFLAASIDSFYIRSSAVYAFGVMGQKYKWAKVIPDSLSSLWLSEVGIRVPSLSGRTINPHQLAKATKSIIKKMEDSGYPFARVKLDSIKINDNCISALIALNQGPKIKIDTLYIKGDAKVKYKYLAALLGLKKGNEYSETRIKQIDQKLKQQAFLSLIKPTEVEFLSRKARIYSYLSNRNASHFAGLVGFYTDETDNRIKLTGDLDLLLVNSLRSGESISFAWSAPGKGTQKLNIETDWPYIFGSQMSANGAFSLYKHDSTYLTVNPKISVGFYTPNGGRILANFDYRKSSYSTEKSVKQSLYGNTSAILYGIGYEFKNFSSQQLPIKGLYIKSILNTGTRKVENSNKGNSNLIDGELAVNTFVPLYESRLILNIRSNSKTRNVYRSKGSSDLYENEMYRIGGIGTIRGFNQEAILSTSYSIATAEIHLRMSEGSGLYLFADKGYVRTYKLGDYSNEWPLGIGLGVNLLTKAGVFNLSYAAGEGFGQSMSIKDAKVHFGITATFR